MKIMNFFLILLFLLINSVQGYSQKNKEVYNTEINKATKVEIENGIVNIKRADTVIVKVFVTKNGSQIFLQSLKEEKDSSNSFTTTIHFVSNKVFSIDIDELIFGFDKPIKEIRLRPTSGGTVSVQGGSSKDKKNFIFSGKISSKNGFDAIIKSNERIKIQIKGIEGVL
jgi:hypothetical protein